MNLTSSDAKHAARTLRADLAAQGIDLAHSRALELVAHQLGFRDWNTASASLDRVRDDSAGLGAPVPVLRVHRFDDVRSFYLDLLGFDLEWEHRFEPGMPVYARVARGGVRLDLSEHHGDGTPGTVVWVPVTDAAALHREVHAGGDPSVRPGLDRDAPGGPTVSVIDPSGNTLRFCQPG